MKEHTHRDTHTSCQTKVQPHWYFILGSSLVDIHLSNRNMPPDSVSFLYLAPFCPVFGINNMLENSSFGFKRIESHFFYHSVFSMITHSSELMKPPGLKVKRLQELFFCHWIAVHGIGMTCWTENLHKHCFLFFITLLKQLPLTGNYRCCCVMLNYEMDHRCIHFCCIGYVLLINHLPFCVIVHGCIQCMLYCGMNRTCLGIFTSPVTTEQSLLICAHILFL